MLQLGASQTQLPWQPGLQQPAAGCNSHSGMCSSVQRAQQSPDLSSSQRLAHRMSGSRPGQHWRLHLSSQTAGRGHQQSAELRSSLVRRTAQTSPCVCAVTSVNETYTSAEIRDLTCRSAWRAPCRHKCSDTCLTAEASADARCTGRQDSTSDASQPDYGTIALPHHLSLQASPIMCRIQYACMQPLACTFVHLKHSLRLVL